MPRATPNGSSARKLRSSCSTFVAPFLLRSAGAREEPLATRTAFAWLGVAFAISIVACYLPYTVFDAWWYTRFLLPALPIALALSSGAVVALLDRTRIPRAVILPWVVALAAVYVTYARSHDVFALRNFERRFITVGTYIGRQLPENAVVITIQQSGSVRHYGHRPAALWDALAPGALDEAVDEFVRVGRQPYILVEDWEEANFRERFAGERYGALDWTPAAEIRDHLVISVVRSARSSSATSAVAWLSRLTGTAAAAYIRKTERDLPAAQAAVTHNKLATPNRSCGRFHRRRCFASRGRAATLLRHHRGRKIGG